MLLHALHTKVERTLVAGAQASAHAEALKSAEQRAADLRQDLAVLRTECSASAAQCQAQRLQSAAYLLAGAERMQARATDAPSKLLEAWEGTVRLGDKALDYDKSSSKQNTCSGLFGFAPHKCVPGSVGGKASGGGRAASLGRSACGSGC